MTSAINGPLALRVLKVALGLTLGTPATLIWLPYMVPFAIFGPFGLARDAIVGHVNTGDVHVIAVALAGTLGLAGFWLWVFDQPGRSVRMQRVVGLFWLIGGVEMGAMLLSPVDRSSPWFAAGAALTVAVLVMGLAMSVWPRRSRAVERSRPDSEAANG